MTREERREYMREWRKLHPDYQKSWRELHPLYDSEQYYKHHERNLARSREYNATHREQRAAAAKRYRENNPDYYKGQYQLVNARNKANGYCTKYYQDNREAILAKRRQYHAEHPDERKAYQRWRYNNVILPRRQGLPEAKWDRSLLPQLVAELRRERGNCGNCKWHDDFSGVCCNGDSDFRAEFTATDDKCEHWEELEKC